MRKSQYYRTRGKVYEMLYGKYQDQDKKMHDYCEEIRVTNRGSIVILKTIEDEDTREERFLKL